MTGNFELDKKAESQLWTRKIFRKTERRKNHVKGNS
jgi:hypothetical protein